MRRFSYLSVKIGVFFPCFFMDLHLEIFLSLLNALALPGIATGAPCHSATERRFSDHKVHCHTLPLFAMCRGCRNVSCG
jgi:hypothetical protein